ncbi:MAG: trypsin-like peptidase domain-containing protein [Bacteroidales bacterium]|nr:trypsin-like peptidase domain-containing protein [Bacteroidales bacterium]
MWFNNFLSTTCKVALAVVAMFGMTACGNVSNTQDHAQQLPDTEVEQAQAAPQIQRTAFLPTENTPDFVDAAEASVNAVVHIKTTIIRKSSSYNDFFGAFLEHLYGIPGQMQNNTMVAYGSGVVLSPDGYIVTNNHVVEGADEVEVTFNNKVVRQATIVGTDPTADLALIKVDGADFDYLVFGDSDKVKVGEWVLAVGNPFNLTSTVTAGIVSAKARNIGILGEGSSVESFIQTDAAVNRGNSGGALVNTRGELIGINAAIASHTGSYEGYSFAIPSNIVRKVVDDLLMYGETQRAYLGIQIGEMNSDLADKSGMKDIKGVYVGEATEGGAAEKAGIRSGDVITQINGNPVNTTTQLMEVIRQYRPGDEVDVDVVRDGRERTFRVSLLNESGSTEVVKKGDTFYNADLGVVLQPASKQEMKSLRINNGLKIVEIRQGAFYGAGVEGFIITAVNGKTVASKNDLETALASNRTRKTYIEGVYPNGMRMNFEYYN